MWLYQPQMSILTGCRTVEFLSSRTSGAAYPQKDLKTFDTHTQTQVNSPRAQITHPHMNIFA